jgi:hypothetical protein
VESWAASSGGTSLATGSITPTHAYEIVISAFGYYYGATTTVAAPMTLSDSVGANSSAGNGIAGSYQIQGSSASAVNPAYTIASSENQLLGQVNALYSVLAPATLSVTTTQLPEGYNGVAYGPGAGPGTNQLSAVGGLAPYTWSCTTGCSGSGPYTITGSGLSLSTAGVITGTAVTGTYSVTFKVTDSASTTATTTLTITVAANQLSISTTSCPNGTQGSSYAGCTITGTGGTPSLSYAATATNPNSTLGTYSTLPEGMSLNSSTGGVTSSLIGGQGIYAAVFSVTDSIGASVSKTINISVTGSNAWMSTIFPSNSIFYHRMDFATSALPTSTNVQDQIWIGYQSATMKPFFGTAGGNGIPAVQVPYNQATVNVLTYVYQCYFGTYQSAGSCSGSAVAPIPSYNPVEDASACVQYPPTAADPCDGHTITYVEAGGGNSPMLYEQWQGTYTGGQWSDASNALWSNTSTNAMITNGTTDAAGLPIAPLLLNADEVIGAGTPSSPSGTVTHPVRYTLSPNGVKGSIGYYEWPATAYAGTGYCYTGPNGTGSIIPRGALSQASSVGSCWSSYYGQNFGPAFGVIFRLKASVARPSCDAASPQAHVIITGLYNYGIIFADNGTAGGLVGTPDPRWNQTDLACLHSLTLANVEPVNVSSLIVSNTSFQAGTGGGTPPTFTSSCPTSTATQGVPYSFSLTATGTTPITFGLYSGTLPSGLSVSGSTVTGTPLGGGTSTFYLDATNTAGTVNQGPCSITVVPVSPTINVGISAAGSIQ